MTRKPKPPPGPSSSDIDLALSSALIRASVHGGATVAQLTDCLRIFFALDASRAMVGNACECRVFDGRAQKVCGTAWPTYIAREARDQIRQKGKP